MKKIKKIINALLITASLYVFNKGFIPLVGFVGFNLWDNPTTQIAMGANEYHYIYFGNNEQKSQQYLKLAHAITMKYLELDNPPFSIGDKLSSKKGDCSEAARFTYSNYLYLTTVAGMPELSSYVRLVGGEVMMGDTKGAHEWLELVQNETWITYETTLNDLDESVIINPVFIDDLILTETMLAPVDWEYNQTSTFQKFPDENIIRTYNLPGIVKSKGLVNLIYSSFID